MSSRHPQPTFSRRGFIASGAGAALALGIAAAPAHARPRPFGPYGSPARRLTGRTLYVDPRGAGDHTTVQGAVDAVAGDGYTLVLAPGVYRETVSVPAGATGLT
jgi:pectinesterase